MTSLSAQLMRLGWTDLKSLNVLTDFGIISCHCVDLSDIAEVDALKASEWLKGLK